MNYFLNNQNFSDLYDNKIREFINNLYTNITLNLHQLYLNDIKLKYNLYNDCKLICKIYK